MQKLYKNENIKLLFYYYTFSKLQKIMVECFLICTLKIPQLLYLFPRWGKVSCKSSFRQNKAQIEINGSLQKHGPPQGPGGWEGLGPIGKREGFIRMQKK